MQTRTAAGFVLTMMMMAGAIGDLCAAGTQGSTFRKIQISPDYYAEGAGAGDFNKDGVMDVVCGPFWYEGPEYHARHGIYPPPAESKDGVFPNDKGYSDNFFSFGYDVNGDGWTDVVTLGFPGKPAHWYQNPQKPAGEWTKHVAFAGVDNESPNFGDVTGDGQPEIICSYQKKLGYAEIDAKNPATQWKWHPISESGNWIMFTHGLGFGDVNGDGRSDFLTATGWHEQPASLDGDPIWEPHPFTFCKGGSQMYAYDVDGDGDNDVITSLMAHAYGLSWFENVKDDKGEITFKEHRIMNDPPGNDPSGVSFSQLHALALHDMDGDGLKDIVTGKCYFAHNGHDPGAFDPAVLYYFRLERGADGVKFAPVKIDDNSGVGRLVTITDLDGDKRPDVVVANKKGVFAFEQSSGKEQAAASGTWPNADAVEPQPLLAQIKRLQQALDFVGSPLPRDVQDSLEALSKAGATADLVRKVQQILDPLCLASVEVQGEGDSSQLSVVPGSAKPELYEQGWRAFLVKVVNRPGVVGALQVESPNAESLPNSPPRDVEARWMDISMYDGRPLKPPLSGLGLEYRIVQLYSTKVGSREAKLHFHLAGPAHAKSAAGNPQIVREWTFENGADGWQAAGDCEIEAQDGLLTFSTKVPGAAMTTAVETDAQGPLELQVWMRADASGFAQVFWKTADETEFGPPRRAGFAIQDGGKPEQIVRLPVNGRLTALRFHPINSQKGKVEIDWMRLTTASSPGPASSELAMTLDTLPATPVTFNVLDENGKPCLAAFTIRDELGRVYPLPSKRLAPDFFFHSQVYRGFGETVRLPAGDYTIQCSRGPESVPETKSLHLGSEPEEFVYKVQRWIDPAQFGWWSGDHHIHAAGCRHYVNPTEGVHAPDMARQIQGEDLKVGCNLTWGPCFDYQKQFFTGKIDAASKYPYLIRYDIEVSGFGSHVSGHLCLLRLREQMYPGGDSSSHWPTLGLNTLKWAKAQGAVCGPAHSGAGLNPTKDRIDGEDGAPIATWFNKTPLPNHFIPQYNGIGANEYIVDITHEVPGPDGKPLPAVDFISTMDTDRIMEWNMWYHTLNCGFRVRASGETDFPCISGERVGMGRVYVKEDDELDYDGWCEGIRQGRSYVSDGQGHLIDFRAEAAGNPQQTVNVGENDSELNLKAPNAVRVFIKAAVRREGVQELPVEVIVNSYPAAKQMIPADGSLQELEFEVPIDKSSWVAVRLADSAHTNPIFALVVGKPIRASASSAEWFLKGVDVCWENKQKTYAQAEQADAKAAYDHAREVYRRILDESRTGD